METVQVTITGDAAAFIHDQVATGRYTSPTEAVTDAIAQARLRAAQERLAELVREGEESGEGVEFTDEWWQRRTAELRAQAAARRRAV